MSAITTHLNGFSSPPLKPASPARHRFTRQKGYADELTPDDARSIQIASRLITLSHHIQSRRAPHRRPAPNQYMSTASCRTVSDDARRRYRASQCAMRTQKRSHPISVTRFPNQRTAVQDKNERINHSNAFLQLTKYFRSSRLLPAVNHDSRQPYHRGGHGYRVSDDALDNERAQCLQQPPVAWER